MSVCVCVCVCECVSVCVCVCVSVLNIKHRRKGTCAIRTVTLACLFRGPSIQGEA